MEDIYCYIACTPRLFCALWSRRRGSLFREPVLCTLEQTTRHSRGRSGCLFPLFLAAALLDSACATGVAGNLNPAALGLQMPRGKSSSSNAASRPSKVQRPHEQQQTEDDSSGGEEKEEEEEVTMDKDGRIAFEGHMDFGFRSYRDALKLKGDYTEQLLIADCKSAFVEGGMTFWMGAGETGRYVSEGTGTCIRGERERA